MEGFFNILLTQWRTYQELVLEGKGFGWQYRQIGFGEGEVKLEGGKTFLLFYYYQNM